MRRISPEIRRIVGNVITVEARGVAYGELAVVDTRDGDSLAQVIRLEGGEARLQVFSGTSGISTGDAVRFLGHPVQLACTPALLGRVFNGIGEPRDRGVRLVDQVRDVETGVVNPARRTKPDTRIHTGVPMIDVFNSLVESQKITVFTVAGEPHQELLARIALQAQVDAIVFAGLGLRHDDYLFFRETLDRAGALARSVLFIHTASDPVVECLAVPDLALAAAESFALAGRRVLVLMTDMTQFCDALKEISIIMEQVPSNRGYPGDLYSQLAARYEKAVAFEGAGSVTILSVTTLPGNDVTHPVPDNTGYITEGQYYLVNGRIEPFGSLSRLKQFVNRATREDHRALMDAMIRLYAAGQETLEKKAMGFRMTSWDRRLLAYCGRFERELMDLGVALRLEAALDLGWEILADCFEPESTGLRTGLIEKYWPQRKGKEGHEAA